MIGLCKNKSYMQDVSHIKKNMTITDHIKLVTIFYWIYISYNPQSIEIYF